MSYQHLPFSLIFPYCEGHPLTLPPTVRIFESKCKITLEISVLNKPKKLVLQLKKQHLKKLVLQLKNNISMGGGGIAVESQKQHPMTAFYFL